jgi:hypothetical protein
MYDGVLALINWDKELEAKKNGVEVAPVEAAPEVAAPEVAAPEEAAAPAES